MEILQLAKLQAEDFHRLFDISSLSGNVDLKVSLLTASTSVVNSIEEGFITHRTIEFRKNFLVIAKGLNGEIRTLLKELLEKEQFDLQQHNLITEKNTNLETKISALLQQLQGGEEKSSDKNIVLPVTPAETNTQKEI